MSRLTWKLIGGIAPYIACAMLIDCMHPYRTAAALGVCIIWANAAGFIEGHLREVTR